MADGHVIQLYDRATLRQIRTFESSQVVSMLRFNNAGDRLAACGWASRTELFDVGTGQKLFESPYVYPTPLRFGPDDRRLAGAVQDGKLGIWQLGDGRELRTLVRKANLEKAAFTYPVSVNPDGRLLAAVMTDGFGLWDLASGSELAFVPVKFDDNSGVLFEPSGALLTVSPTGLFRWPVRTESTSANTLLIGPPERLPVPCGRALGQSGDGRVIVTCARAVGPDQAYAGGWILHADRASQPIRLDAGADIGFIAVSPDGRWVVTVTHFTGTGCRSGMPVTGRWSNNWPNMGPAIPASAQTAAGCPRIWTAAALSRWAPGSRGHGLAVMAGFHRTASSWPSKPRPAWSRSLIRSQVARSPGWRTPAATEPIGPSSRPTAPS